MPKTLKEFDAFTRALADRPDTASDWDLLK